MNDAPQIFLLIIILIQIKSDLWTLWYIYLFETKAVI